MCDRRVLIAAVLTIAPVALAQPKQKPPADDEIEMGDDAPADKPVVPAPTVVVPAPTTATTPASVAETKPDAPLSAEPVKQPVFTFEPFGYFRLQYRVVQNDPFVAFVGRDDGFEMQNARFGVRGLLANKIAYKFSIDGAVDERTQVNVPDGRLRVGIRDAFGDAALSGDLGVRAGYFRSLVDPDLDDDTEREFIDRPIESRGVRPTQGFETPGLPPGRSLGVALRMDAPPTTGMKVGFELAVQNGTDEFASDNDNDTPAMSASVIARAPNRTWLVASGRWNRRTAGQLPLQRTEDDFQGTLGARIAAGPIAFGGGAIVQRTAYPTTGGPVRNAYGAHAQVLLKLPGTYPLSFGYRFGILDPSSLILTDRVMEHTAGAEMVLPQLRMRLQLQLVHVVEQGERNLKNDRAQLAAELAL